MDSLTLNDIKKEYLKKKINKASYVKKIYQKKHSALFEYSRFINKTDIKSIKITDSNVSVITRAYGIDFFFQEFDQRSNILDTLNFNNYEKKELDAILQIIPKCKNFFDIGANIGWYSLIVAKYFKKIKVYAFEPIKETYGFLRKNINKNSLKNIKSYNFGFYSENKNILFSKDKNKMVNTSIRSLNSNKNLKLEKCKVITLDNFVFKNKIRVDFIKCDIEGAELFAFLGAKKTLLKFKPIVFCEMLRKWCAKFRYSPNDIILLFHRLGYGCFCILKSKKKFSNKKNQFRQTIIKSNILQKFHLKEIKKIDKNTHETNIFFISE